MTIAMCYVSPEGVVFGADSTASLSLDNSGFHYFNHNQKLFQIGENSSLGWITWGLGGLSSLSYRTLVAQLADDLAANPPATVLDVAQRWASSIWAAYTADSDLAPKIQRIGVLAQQPPYVAAVPVPLPNARTEAEEGEYNKLRIELFVGFCIGGTVIGDRTPRAYEISIDPVGGPPTPQQIPTNNVLFRGAPNIIQRLIFGCDDLTKMSLMQSGFWGGSLNDLNNVLAQHTLAHPLLPIREAIDFVYACIYSTIKAFKFSSMSQICGGPVELAVVTSDRNFRWVRHKGWDSAITDGDI